MRAAAPDGRSRQQQPHHHHHSRRNPRRSAAGAQPHRGRARLHDARAGAGWRGPAASPPALLSTGRQRLRAPAVRPARPPAARRARAGREQHLARRPRSARPRARPCLSLSPPRGSHTTARQHDGDEGAITTRGARGWRGKAGRAPAAPRTRSRHRPCWQKDNTTSSDAHERSVAAQRPPRRHAPAGRPPCAAACARSPAGCAAGAAGGSALTQPTQQPSIWLPDPTRRCSHARSVICITALAPARRKACRRGADGSLLGQAHPPPHVSRDHGGQKPAPGHHPVRAGSGDRAGGPSARLATRGAVAGCSLPHALRGAGPSATWDTWIASAGGDDGP